jgi:uncharacterized protein (DUF4415 family)
MIRACASRLFLCGEIGGHNKLKRQVTIRIDEDALEYFKSLTAEMGMPYQSLINSYLRECAHTHKRPSVKWA